MKPFKKSEEHKVFVQRRSLTLPRAASPRGGPLLVSGSPCRGLGSIVNSGLQCSIWYYTSLEK